MNKGRFIVPCLVMSFISLFLLPKAINLNEFTRLLNLIFGYGWLTAGVAGTGAWAVEAIYHKIKEDKTDEVPS